MRKIAIILFFTMSGYCMSAQSFQFIEHGTSTVAQSNYTRNITDASSGDQFSIDIKNISGSDKTYRIRKTILTEPKTCSEPEIFHFCDALNCYGSGSSVSSDDLPIKAGQVVDPLSYGISADMDPATCFGTYVVRYTVFNVNNTNDSTSFTLTYMVGTVGISNVETKNFKIGNISPNPVSTSASIKYDFPIVPQSASIKVYNMIGLMVTEIKIDGQKGKVLVDPASLSNGVYFYSLFVNDNIIATKQLIVNH